MSDRIAVFNDGRIAQIGTPAEVYEHPGSPFVAGFVGTSNLLVGETAEALLGTRGTFSVRPEKITITPAGEAKPAGAGDVEAAGRIVEVIYAGPVTRFVVDLAAGPRFVAVAQNQETTSSDVSRLRETDVVLTFRREHVVAVPADAVPATP